MLDHASNSSVLAGGLSGSPTIKGIATNRLVVLHAHTELALWNNNGLVVVFYCLMGITVGSPTALEASSGSSCS
jgi:hypothetical protein